MFKSLDEHPLFKQRSATIDPTNTPQPSQPLQSSQPTQPTITAITTDINNNNILLNKKILSPIKNDTRSSKIQRFQNSKNLFENLESSNKPIVKGKPPISVKPRKFSSSTSTNNEKEKPLNEEPVKGLDNVAEISDCSNDLINTEEITNNLNELEMEAPRTPPAIKQRSYSATHINSTNLLDHSFDTTSSNETSSSTHLNDFANETNETNPNNNNNNHLNNNIDQNNQYINDQFINEPSSSSSSSSLTNKQFSTDGYLQPVVVAQESEELAPFPFPRGNFIKLRTDLAVDDVFDNIGNAAVVESPVFESFNAVHGYMNEANDLFLDEASNQNRRQLLIDLIGKENDYIQMMKILIDEYYQILNKEENNFLSNTQKDLVFKYLKEMYNFHVFEFLPELEKRVDDWSLTKTPLLCDLFLKHMAKIKLYEKYILNLKEAIQCIDVTTQAQPLFRTHLKEIDSRVQSNYMKKLVRMKIERPALPTFKSLLNYVQIWPDFTNKFLIAYENFISLEHPDFKNFEEAIKYFNDLATKSFESIDDAKRIETLTNLQNRIGNKFNILDRKRVLLKEGPLVTLSPHLGSIIRIYIVLYLKLGTGLQITIDLTYYLCRPFCDRDIREYIDLLNDLLIICDPADTEYEQLKPKRPLDAIGMSVSSEVNAFTGESARIRFPSASRKENLIDPEKGFSINVPCVQKVFKFYARNVQEKNKWFSVFRTVAQANKIETEIDRSNISKKRPKFIPEKLSQYCFKCKSEFNAINRKHYCKACGYIFCKYCTRMQASLEYDGGKRGRVCDFCYDSLYHTFRSMPPSLDQINNRFRQSLSHVTN